MSYQLDISGDKGLALQNFHDGKVSRDETLVLFRLYNVPTWLAEFLVDTSPIPPDRWTFGV